jgi:hypothetical protein
MSWAADTRSDSVEIDALAWLDPPLLLEQGVAGRSYEVTIGGRPTTLTLPNEGMGEFRTDRTETPGRLPSFPEPPLALPLGRASTSLSLARGAREGELVAQVIRLQWRDNEFFAGELEESGRNPNEFSRELGAWLAMVRNWLAAWSENVRDRVEPEPTPLIQAALAGDPATAAVTGGRSRFVYIQDQRPSTALELEAAFAAASRSERVPLEHQLLNDARVHVHRGENRYAVITACTAAEVALSGSAQALLAAAGRSEEEVAEILEGVSGVVELYRLNAGSPLGGVSIKRVKGQLAGPRNAAAHRGQEIDDEVARRSICTARDLLEVSPLRAPELLLGG